MEIPDPSLLMLRSLMIRVKLQTVAPQISFMWMTGKRWTRSTTSSLNFSRSTYPEFEGVISPSPTNQKCRIMSKWVQFYHKINKFDLVNMRFTDEFSVVEMYGTDSILPVDGRFNMSSIRAEIQKYIESMEKIKSFDPCAFSILTGSSILCASESPVYNL